jgi:D-alanyl-D-alanine dipeptidase
MKNNNSVIPNTCGQSILVLTDSLEASKGLLYYFERDNVDSNWELLGKEISVVLGRNGLGWGIGIHDSSSLFNYPIKKEGDGRSPAGIFNLSFVFGYKQAEELSNLKMPYIQITEMVECIDDINSDYYNQIVDRNKTEKVDWATSERMIDYGIYYQLGVVVDHNSNSIRNGAGSCIFLHNWLNPNEAMVGCTAMEPIKMQEIVDWLNIDSQPVLIQLTKKSYSVLLEEWNLPNIN